LKALGSSPFIDRSGSLDFHVILRTLESLVERCPIPRILEVVLNIADTLLNLPAYERVVFFEQLLSVRIWNNC
jgi:hypothetical protein